MKKIIHSISKFINNFKDRKNIKDLFNQLNKKEMGIYEIKYFIKHGKRFPCNYKLK